MSWESWILTQSRRHSSFCVGGRKEWNKVVSDNVILWKEECRIDCDEEVPLERNVPGEGERTMSEMIVLVNVTDEDESGLSCVTTNVWSEGEVKCEVSWMASSFNLPDEWNGMNLEWTSRILEEIVITDLESKK